jgi:hypothetical protein
MVAYYGNWHRMEVGAFTLFYGGGNCPGLLSCGVILLHDNACPHTAKQARKLLKHFYLEMLEIPP